jgi:hypothetical protein
MTVFVAVNYLVVYFKIPSSDLYTPLDTSFSNNNG